MAVLKIYYEKTAGMDYLYKITVEIDNEKVLSLQQHDLDAVYKTVREAFVGCNFKEVPTDNKQIAFVTGTVTILSARSGSWQMLFMTVGSASI